MGLYSGMKRHVIQAKFFSRHDICFAQDYTRPVRHCSAPGHVHASREEQETNKQTPWPLVRKRTIPTDDRHMLAKFSANFCLWSSGGTSWLQTQRSRVRFPALQIFWVAVGLELGPLSPCEDKWRATWKSRGQDTLTEQKCLEWTHEDAQSQRAHSWRQLSERWIRRNTNWNLASDEKGRASNWFKYLYFRRSEKLKLQTNA
jgi:hypothetical protein